MALISLQHIHTAFGADPVLEDVSLHVEKNQRLGLLGRNGSGKSTLLKIAAGLLAPDRGTVQRSPGLRVSYFSQEIPGSMDGSAFRIIAQGLGRRGRLLCDYHDESAKAASGAGGGSGKLHGLQDQMNSLDAWTGLEEVEKIMSRMSLNPDWDYNALSGGQKRRVLLAAALVSNPDVLLLDEPTNHLDVQAITWLEEYLLRTGMTVVFVTHDRMLLSRLAAGIIELDRGRLTVWSCDYDSFLQRKQALLDSEERAWEKFDRKLAAEEIWIRKGIRARRTRDEGRVRALLKMRQERQNRRLRQGEAVMQIDGGQRSGRVIIEARDLCFGFGDEPLVRNFSTQIVRGDKIGIIGPNGCGKTTLVNLLLGSLTPRSGTLKTGTKQEVTYYDQLRERLDEQRSVRQNVTPGSDFIEINGKKKHIVSYLRDFLFTPEQAVKPVSSLSGGERNRLLLARLFTLPANVLIMDEPTNDLDVETLELLEELLVNFEGTLLLICHDRAFLNNVVTSTLVFEEGGRVKEYAGGYDDYLRQAAAQKPVPARTRAPAAAQKVPRSQSRRSGRPEKLTNLEKEALKTLPGIIEQLEEEQARIHEQMADPDFFREKERIVLAAARLEKIGRELTQRYERWEELESIETARKTGKGATDADTG